MARWLLTTCGEGVVTCALRPARGSRPAGIRMSWLHLASLSASITPCHGLSVLSGHAFQVDRILWRNLGRRAIPGLPPRSEPHSRGNLVWAGPHGSNRTAATGPRPRSKPPLAGRTHAELGRGLTLRAGPHSRRNPGRRSVSEDVPSGPAALSRGPGGHRGGSREPGGGLSSSPKGCLLYTSDAADE